MTRFCSGLVAVLIASTSAYALPVPTNLSMRTPKKKRWGAQVAQATPAPPPTPDTAPAAPPPPEAPPEPAAVEAPPPPLAPPAPNVAEEPELTPEQMAELEALAGQGEVITITGSLIERDKALTTAAPVSIIDKKTIEASGLVTVGDVLQNLPAQSNAINTQFNNGGDGSTRVDLRGLGSARTLVLLNGRRIVAGGTGADPSVDLNSIPLAVIERVEVLKDGASAVYGSDAIAGVVNIITRDDFDGQEATVYTGGTQRGDGFTYDLSFVTGHKTDKSNFVFSAGYMEQRPIFAGDRGFSEFDKEFTWEDGTKVNGGSTNTPYGFLVTDEDGDGVPDPGNAAWDAQVVGACPSGVCTRDGQDGAWRDFNFGGANDNGDFYNFQPLNYLLTPLQRYNVFSKGKVELKKHIKGFYEAMYMHRGSTQQLAPEPLPLDQLGLVISADNFYNPYGKDIAFYRRRLEELGNRVADQTVDTFRVVAGLEGDIPEDVPVLGNWRWELSYNYGRTQGQQVNRGNLILSRLQNAMGPSFVDDAGVAHCGTETAPIDGCVPINLLGGSGAISPDQIDGLTFTGVQGGLNEQRTWLASARGPILKMDNGGFLALGVGADYREEAGSLDPDPLTSTGDTTGNAIEPTGGDFNVVEGFGEISFVPLVEKGPAKWLELNAAARGFKYNTFGSGGTWKVGSLFRTLGGVSVRGTYSTAFRNPSINELFSGAFDDFESATDPCDTTAGPLDPTVAEQCAAEGVPGGFVSGATQQRAKVGGNPNLDPEKAKVFTAGVVLEPPPLKGFAITLDYFNVNIDDAIQAQGADVILANCYNTPEHTDCDKIHRFPGTNTIDFIDDTIVNIGSNKTTGLDFAVSQMLDTGKKIGTFKLNLEGTYLLTYTESTPDRTRSGVGNYDLGVFPRIKMNFNTLWGLGGWGAGLNIRFIGPYKECLDNDCNDNLPSRNVSSNATADVFASYNFGSSAGKTTVSVGVNNVLDQDPPFLANGFLADSDASTYDYLGRYFYLRLSQLL